MSVVYTVPLTIASLLTPTIKTYGSCNFIKLQFSGEPICLFCLALQIRL